MSERNFISDRETADREEIIRDLDSNIFVEAGAGAGKTSILVRRILNQLRTGRAKAEELAAITFTNKAAQELKTRIGDEIRRALHRAGHGTAEYNNLKEAIYNLDRMQISTIHSFCYRLLMEQTFLASMRMDMEMIEDEDAIEEQKAFFHSWYKKLDYPTLKGIRENFAGRKAADVLRDAFCAVCQLPDDTEIYYDRKLLRKTLQDFKDEASVQKARLAVILVEALNREGGTHFEPHPDSMILAAEEGYFLGKFKALVLGTGSDIDFLKKTIKNPEYFNSKKLKGMRKDDCNAMAQACLDRFFKSFDMEAYERNFRAYQNALIIAAILPAREEYRKHHQNRQITNDSLLEKARNLVVNHPEARAFFQRKYKCIYVDEFQDTDHVQTDLIFSLCTDESGILKPGSLFLVGDPKQSIYRFRGADLPLYFSVKEKMGDMPGCRIFHLNYNFRSGEDVISFVNDNNAEVLRGYQPMVSRSEEPADQRPDRQLSGVYINWDPDPEAPEEERKPKSDADEVVSTIRGLVDNRVRIWDKEKKCHRPVCYRDFLVLCYSTNQMDDYLEAMLAAEIPVQISGKVDMTMVRELNRFANLYRYLAYPQYTKAREGALQTVLGGNVNEDNYQTGAGRLNRIREEVKGMDGISMALYLARHLEYTLDWDEDIDKYYLLRIQAQLQQMLETVSADTVNHPQALSDGFMEYLSGSVDRELSLSPESDAVRFMNLHKAKGLEGRIVIICKRTEDFSPKESSFQVKKDSGGGYLYYHTVKETINEFNSNLYPAYVHDDGIRQKAEEEELAEYRRLEYVEATRAMEALIFMRPGVPEKTRKGEEGKRYSFKGYSFKDCKRIDLEFPEFYDDCDQEGADSGGQQTEDALSAPYDSDRWGAEFSDERFSEGYLSLTPSSLERNVNAADSAQSADPQEKKRPTGNLFGTVMHRALELLIKDICEGAEPGDNSIRSAILQAVMESGDELEEAFGSDFEQRADEYSDFLIKVLGKFAANEKLVTEIRRSEAVFTEYPFSFFTTEKEDPGIFEALRGKISGKMAERLLPSSPDQKVWIHGKADLLMVQADGKIHVLDYKSDMNAGLTEEEFKDVIGRRYGGQMELYRHVCAKLFDTPLEQIAGDFYLIDSDCREP